MVLDDSYGFDRQTPFPFSDVVPPNGVRIFLVEISDQEG